MSDRLKITMQLFILFGLLSVGGLLLLRFTTIDLASSTFIIISFFCTIITLAVYLAVSAGIRKGGSAQVSWTLAGISGKFLAYLLFILIYWAFTKNLTNPFIIAFFAVYLVLTFFLVVVLLKLLRTN